MKKLITTLFFLFPILTYAQRNIDLATILVSPVNKTFVEKDNGVDIVATIKNLGNDTITASDTIRFYMYWDNAPVPFANDSFKVIIVNNLKPGDSITRGLLLSPMLFTFTGDMNFCAELIAVNASDPIHDVNLSNNKSCSRISIVPTSVQDVASKVQVSAYPNPASSVLNFDVVLPGAMSVSLSLIDIRGQQVTRIENDFQLGGKQTIRLNTNEFPSGMYFYKFAMADKTIEGKVQIAR